jgi:hypothetical protein
MARPSLARPIVYSVVFVVILASLLHSTISIMRLFAKEAPPSISVPDNKTSHHMVELSKWLLGNLQHQGQEMSEPTTQLLQRGFLSLLSFLVKSKVLPFRTPRYPATKGVLDRLPLEQFMRQVAAEHEAVRFKQCIEWGPFFKNWRKTTQPYLQLFNCTHNWMFVHHPSASSVKSSIREDQFGTVAGDVDIPLEQQGLEALDGFFDLIIIPQTLQYAQRPHQALKFLFDLLAPGGTLIISAPFVQITLPYEVKGKTRQADFWRFTVEGLEHLLTSSGFLIQSSFVGGDRLAALLWLLEGGQTDLEGLDQGDDTLIKKTTDYSHPAYMIALNVAKKPPKPV